MSKASESMFDGKNVLIPLAEVSYILKFQNCIEVRFKDSTEPLTLVQPDKNAFISAWCRYRSEVEADTLMDLTGAHPAPSFADAYQGAMEEVAIWKKRALEAEDLNRKFIAEINGPAYMGEHAQPAPSVRSAALYPVISWLRNGCDPMKAADELEILTAATEAKP